DQLFREARAQLEQGRYQEACRLFERSFEIDPSPGTLLNLGNCHEQAGDLARAYTTFDRAVADARLEPDAKKREAWVEAGTRRRDSLAARVPVVTLSPSPTAGASVSVDARAIMAVGEPLRLNAGHHVVEVTAPGRQTATREFTLALGQALTVALPALEPLPAAPAPVEPPPPVASDGDHAPRRSAGPWVLMGTGGALVLSGVVTGLLAKSKENELESGCGPGSTCDPSLREVRDSGENLALATYLLWGVGGAGVAAGLIWFATEDRGAGATELSAGCSGASCGLFANGTF
ncbi:MAG TPA: tetratricopeptide repeat protein, partial [Polyangiaceae bacterium]|nr:tetratricopeptide repeat protein [Polyangiaceae bacterium]